MKNQSVKEVVRTYDTSKNETLEKGIIADLLANPLGLFEIDDLVDEKKFYSIKWKTWFSELRHSILETKTYDPFELSDTLYKRFKSLKHKNPYKDFSHIEEAIEDEIEKLLYARNISADAKSKAYALTEYWMEREAYNNALRVISGISSGKDVFSILNNNVKKNEELLKAASNKSEQIADVEEEVYEEIAEGLQIVETQFSELNEIAPLAKGELHVYAARPGMGKTAYALSILLNAGRQGKQCAFYSSEMSKNQIIRRLVSYMTGIHTKKIRKGYLPVNETEKQKVVKLSKTLPELKVFLVKELKEDRKIGLSLSELQEIVFALRELKTLPIYLEHEINFGKIKASAISLNNNLKKTTANGLELVIIDYLQFLESAEKYSRRDLEVGAISKNSKRLSQEKQADCNVMLLSQLSRAVESRGGSKRPQLSDLRESGSIEQDADVVGFLLREDYYRETGHGHGFDDDEYEKDVAEIIIAKNRHDAVGTIKAKFERGQWIGDLDSNTVSQGSDNSAMTSARPIDDDIPF